MATGVRIEGLNQVTRALLELGLEVDDLKDAFSRVAREGAIIAADLAPRRSGALAATVRGNRAKNKAVVAAGKGRVKYAGVINYGWPKRGIQASSFMQKADEAMRPLALELLEEEINKAIERKDLN